MENLIRLVEFAEQRRRLCDALNAIEQPRFTHLAPFPMSTSLTEGPAVGVVDNASGDWLDIVQCGEFYGAYYYGRRILRSHEREALVSALSEHKFDYAEYLKVVRRG